MATPLGELLRQLRSDTDIQARFQQSPAEYLHEHGWGDLDAGDMQEALLLLADAAPASEASGWITAGEAIDPEAAETATALDTAIGTFLDDTAHEIDVDTDTIDEIDHLGESDPGDIDGITPAEPVAQEPDTAAPDTAHVDATPAATTDTAAADLGEFDHLDELADAAPPDDLDGGFDPTAPDTAPHPDTPLTEDPTDRIAPDLDPEPDWDDPS